MEINILLDFTDYLNRLMEFSSITKKKKKYKNEM